MVRNVAEDITAVYVQQVVQVKGTVHRYLQDIVVLLQLFAALPATIIVELHLGEG